MEVHYIVREIKVVLGVCTTDVPVLVLVTLCNKLLKVREYLIIAALSADKHSHAVIDLFPAVYRENDVVHLLVQELYLLIIEYQTVSCHSEAETLVSLLLTGAAVLYQLLYHIVVEHRLSAEEIDLKIIPVSRFLDKKIKCLLTCFKTHKPSALAVIALCRKAVLASHIAVLRNNQAHSLYWRVNSSERKLLIIVIAEQYLILIKRDYLIIALSDLLL